MDLNVLYHLHLSFKEGFINYAMFPPILKVHKMPKSPIHDYMKKSGICAEKIDSDQRQKSLITYLIALK